jgi:CHAD domain-containing protein
LESGAAPAATVTVALRASVHRLQQSLDRKLEDLSKAVTPDTVHRSRIAARRLRALLRAFRRELNPSAFRLYAAALQELAHDLDAVREAHVTQQKIASTLKERFGRGHSKINGLKEFV